VEREIIGENFEKKKREIGEEKHFEKKNGKKNIGRDSGRKKEVERKFRKITL
jgi:hypothetical protein